MTDPTPGITHAGLVTERFPAARRRVADLWRGRFGQNSPIASGTENGGIIDVIALCVSLLWEGFEGTFSGSFLRSSVERALDLWVDGFGFTRLEAAPSRVLLTAWGDAEATLPEATVVTVRGTGSPFATATAAQVNDGIAGLVWIVYVVDVTLGPFELVVGGLSFEIVPANVSIPDVSQQYVDAIVAGSPDATAGYVRRATVSEGGHGVIVIRSLTDGPITVTGSSAVTVYPAVDVEAVALDDGPTSASRGSLVDLAAPVVGIVGVANAIEAQLGRGDETNSELRRRFLLGQGRREKATRRAVRSALLRLAEEYELPYAEARARENTSDEWVDGRPPHSIAPLYYLPGIPFEVIAAAILDVRSNGYQSFGSETAIVLDSGGLAVEIGATPATVAYLWVRITVNTVGETWPTDYNPIAAILASVRAWLVTPGRLEIGVDLYRLDLHGPVLAAVPVGAIKVLVVELATTAAVDDAPTYVDADLVVGDETVLVPEAARVSVVPPL